MRVLLDNCVDRNLAKSILGHKVATAAELGWGDLSNGVLLARAAERFDVFITVDKNLRYQQNLAKLPIAVVEIDSVTSRIDELLKFVPHLAAALAVTDRFRFVGIKVDGSLETLSPRGG